MSNHKISAKVLSSGTLPDLFIFLALFASTLASKHFLLFESKWRLKTPETFLQAVQHSQPCIPTASLLTNALFSEPCARQECACQMCFVVFLPSCQLFASPPVQLTFLGPCRKQFADDLNAASGVTGGRRHCTSFTQHQRVLLFLSKACNKETWYFMSIS